jgi:hypothetical protein
VVHSVCCLGGASSLIDDIRADLRAEGIPAAIRRHDTATLFDWLVSALSYQGISDQVASDYMERHGRAQWHDIDAKVAASPTCPKLKSYWHFHGCRYDKISRTCSEPDHIDACPVPSHQLRNGRLNQMATPSSYSFATLPMVIWSAGSTSNSKMPTTQPAPVGCPDCGKL